MILLQPGNCLCDGKSDSICSEVNDEDPVIPFMPTTSIKSTASATFHSAMSPRVTWVGLGYMGGTNGPILPKVSRRSSKRNFGKTWPRTSPPMDPSMPWRRYQIPRSKVVCAQNPDTKVASNYEESITISDTIFMMTPPPLTIALPHVKNKLFLDCSTVHPNIATRHRSIQRVQAKDSGNKSVLYMFQTIAK